MSDANAAIALPTRLDVGTSAAVRSQMRRALDEQEGDLVLDLRAVEIVDAAGLGVLVGARRRADADGRSVVLRETPARVARLLDATRLSRLFVLD